MNSDLHPTTPIPKHVDQDASAVRSRLRRQIRAKRRNVSDAEAAVAARNVARHLSARRLLRPGTRVGVYLRQGSELDLSGVIALARQRGCHLYLPTITHANSNRMEFLSFATGQRLRRNRFGILEPDPTASTRVPALQLDLIVLPVVAVDGRGWRLGSGAGFYDRYLSHLTGGRRWRRPRLIAVAFEFQRVPLLEPEPWDVPLDALVTDRGFYPFQANAHHPT